MKLRPVMAQSITGSAQAEQGPDDPFKGIDTPCAEYEAMADQWSLCQDLRGGTAAMQAAGIKYLPQEPAEEDDKYAIRLNRCYLYPGFDEAVKKLASKPFEKPITVEGSIPTALTRIETNADRGGKTLSKFGKAVFEDALTFGLTHILIDYPAAPVRPDGQRKKLSVLDANTYDVRPYFCHVRALSLFAWQSEYNPATQRRELTQIRIREQRQEPVGAWESKTTEYIRVWTRASIQDYVQDPKTKRWSLSGPPKPNTLGAIPLVTITLADCCGYMHVEKPPLWSLAETNRVHWQSTADQRNVLRFARFAILHQTGVTEKEKEKPIVISPSCVVRGNNPAGTLGFVEHTGAAIKIGQDDLDNLEAKMDQMAGKPMMQRPSGTDVTATEKTIDEGKAASELHEWIEALRCGIEESYRWGARWTSGRAGDLDPIPKLKVNVFKDFALYFKKTEDIATMTAMRGQGDLSRETLLAESARRGLFSSDFKVEEEMARIDREPPPLGLVPPTPDGEDDSGKGPTLNDNGKKGAPPDSAA